MLDDSQVIKGARGAVLSALWQMPGGDRDAIAKQLESRLSGDPVVAGVNWGSPYWALDVTREDTMHAGPGPSCKKQEKQREKRADRRRVPEYSQQQA